jgi:hypothetical protein
MTDQEARNLPADLNQDGLVEVAIRPEFVKPARALYDGRLDWEALNFVPAYEPNPA